MTPEESSETRKARVLRERAESLAREGGERGVPEAVFELAEFSLAGEQYAIETLYVREAHRLEQLTPLPCAPEFIAGLIQVRRRIVPVIDFKKFFDLPDAGITDLHAVILLRQGEAEFGILADRIGGIRRIAAAEVKPAPAALAGVRTDYLKGVTAKGLVILDGKKIVGDPRLEVNEEP